MWRAEGTVARPPCGSLCSGKATGLLPSCCHGDPEPSSSRLPATCSPPESALVLPWELGAGGSHREGEGQAPPGPGEEEVPDSQGRGCRSPCPSGWHGSHPLYLPAGPGLGLG